MTHSSLKADELVAMAKPGKPRWRITRLRLQRWRNFMDVDLRLASRAFFVGPNASGKSNLLDAVRFLHDVAAVGGGFQSAVDSSLRGGVSSLRCLAARKNPNIVIHVDVGDEDFSDVWSYRLEFTQDPMEKRPAVVKETVTRCGSVILERPNREDDKDPKRLSQTHLEQVNTNAEFRDLTEFLASSRYTHVVPQLIREPDRSTGRTNDPFGSDLMERIAQTRKQTRDARLRRINQALRVAVPQLEELELWREPATGVPHLRGKYQHWRPQGAWQTEERFSDGTLRLLGLLWVLLEPGGPLLLEEPELSLHPEIVSVIPQMFVRMQRNSGRQVLVSTHSTALLADPGIGLDEVHLLRPGKDGTEIETAGSIGEVEALLQGGLNMGEAVLPRTRPRYANPRQLALALG